MTEPRFLATIRSLPDGELERCEGTAPAVAAFLRASADQLDPPRRPTRGLASLADAPAPSGIPLSDSPGPASGLRTALRDTPPHRDRKGPGRMGFGPVHATTEEPS